MATHQDHRTTDEDDSEIEEGTSGASDTTTVGICVEPSVAATILYQRLKNTECDLKIDPHGPTIHTVGMEIVPVLSTTPIQSRRSTQSDSFLNPQQSAAFTTPISGFQSGTQSFKAPLGPASKKLLLIELPEFVHQKTQVLGQTKWMSEIRLPTCETRKLCGITYIDPKNIFVIGIFILNLACGVPFGGSIGYSVWLHSGGSGEDGDSGSIGWAAVCSILLALFESLIYFMAVHRVFDLGYIIWYVLQFLILLIQFSFLVFLIIGFARGTSGAQTIAHIVSVILLMFSTLFSFTLLWTAHIMRQFIQLEDQSMRSVTCIERPHKILCEKPLFLWAIGLFHVHKHQ